MTAIPSKGRKKWWKGLPYLARKKVRENLLPEGKTICCRCYKIKSLKSFSTMPNYWLGVSTTCKLCTRTRQKRRYHEDPEFRARVQASGRSATAKKARKKYYRKLRSTKEGREKFRARARATYKKFRPQMLAASKKAYRIKRAKLKLARDPEFQEIKRLLDW